MTPEPRRILLAWVAGIVSAAAALLIAYVAGVVAVAVNLRDLFATLLTAVTFLPVMLIIVFLPLDLLAGTAVGLMLGLCSRLAHRTLGAFTGAALGIVAAELVFSVLLPLVLKPGPSTDFGTVIGNPLLSGLYGVVLAGVIFRRLCRRA
jgi:acid phosphatase family membrane protein YuiD